MIKAVRLLLFLVGSLIVFSSSAQDKIFGFYAGGTAGAGWYFLRTDNQQISSTDYGRSHLSLVAGVEAGPVIKYKKLSHGIIISRMKFFDNEVLYLNDTRGSSRVDLGELPSFWRLTTNIGYEAFNSNNYTVDLYGEAGILLENDGLRNSYSLSLGARNNIVLGNVAIHITPVYMWDVLGEGVVQFGFESIIRKHIIQSIGLKMGISILIL